MSTFKKAKVVMLSTNNKSNIVLGKRNTLYNTKDIPNVEFNNVLSPNNWIYQHLYIISDDEIKENNTHFYNPHSGQLHISGNHTDYIAINKNGCKKIIATTDVSLGLPQPSQQFIQKYIEEYNKGNIITNVLVEYNCGDSHCSLFGCQKHLGCKNESIQTVKINPKDNTITIKKLKDSWNREEVSNLIKLFANNYQYASNDIGYNKWIEENL